MSKKSTKWTMPKWMERYRPYLDAGAGGNPIEELMNDKETTSFNNIIRWAIIATVESRVGLLKRLHEDGLLARESESK